MKHNQDGSTTDSIFETKNEEIKPLDREYLGLSFNMPGWDVLVMAPPVIKKIGHVLQTSHTQDSMKAKANLGILLKLGDKAYTEVDKNNIPLPVQPPKPYKPGDIVFFEDMHPEVRNVNGVMVYFLSDQRIICSVKNPDEFDHYLLFKDGLEEYKQFSKEWLSMTVDERKECAATILKDRSVNDSVDR